MMRINGEFVEISTGDYLIYQQLKRIADSLERMASSYEKPEPWKLDEKVSEPILAFDEIMDRYSRVYNELMHERFNDKEENK